ncbi:unnamed protein product [Euphydryas editha]|uniref:trypsin n=1 Tax=Euphydryas editha TaxID=104508 RepID=A0AAU9UMV1_EUPED|nr:unnamed protein product [Euphydryas editha]
MWKLTFVFNLVLSVVLTEFIENDKIYSGRLTPECVKHYHQMYITREVPPRRYLYHHEILAGLEELEKNAFADIGFRIVGGEKISIETVPFQVLYGKYCGGTLISPDWVLTAAHCNIKESFVYAGSTQRDHTEGYRICAHFLHPLWNTTNPRDHDYDYQLVLLERPIPVTPMSRPIAIGSYSDIQAGELVSVSGWGHLAYKKSSMQNLLRRIYIPIMTQEECSLMDNDVYKKLTPRMFCAGYVEGNKDSCQGDSGGPVVINGKLIGLVSYGVGCAAPNKPGVYSNVPAARDWIRNVTGLPL